MKTIPLFLRCCMASIFLIDSALAAKPKAPQVAPDLTKDQAVDRKATYNLGSTGLRGWIYLKPATHFDGLQGRTTEPSRQILVTHVGENSPASGVVKVNDVILGVGGKPFNDDARKSIAVAIQEAEKEANGGILKLTCWREGKTLELQIKLRVMGTYAATAPYHCDKSKRIYEEACVLLAKEPLTTSWHGWISGLALLATGNPDYLPMVRELAYKAGPENLDIQNALNAQTWDLGYRNIFLCEYYLLTKDKKVLHAINEITLSLARGQSMYGTLGHKYAGLTTDGKRNGSVAPYGPVNQVGLVVNIGIVMGRKCGVDKPEVDAAIGRASGFVGYFVDKGTIPYGEHMPYEFHDNNGKSAMSAMLFGLQQGRTPETRFFASMATAGHRNRECGHTGQGFSYLWGALGANVGGPEAVAAFFKEASWHFDLVRRCDGSFTYDGSEQYGPGKTDDDTYYGKSGYNGLSPNAVYVLTYSLPLKKILLTGRESDRANWLSKMEATAVSASGRFDLDCKKMNPEELVMAFRDWSPIVRGWAAEELAKRPEAKAMVPALIVMAEGPDAHARQGACETLGILKSSEALPVFVRLLRHKDRWLRFKAATAIKDMGLAAKPVVPDLLKVLAETAEPLYPINWEDPIQFTHGQLATIFRGPLASSIKESDRKLLYPAIQTVSKNADGRARGQLGGFFETALSLEDVQALAPTILEAIMTPSPADTMFSNEIRMGGYKALTKYHFKEAIPAGVHYAKTQGGHGSQIRTAIIVGEIAKYGTAAREAIPGLRELIESLNKEVADKTFPGSLNGVRVSAVEDAIRTIEAATTQPELRTIKAPAK